MKQILVFAGSSSKKSINKQLAVYASSLLNDFKTKVLDLNDFELPIYSEDFQQQFGIPKAASDFLDLIKNSDAIILSLAEHNGAYSAAFKNLFDWMSVKDGKLWSNLPMLLMATSPGVRGGQSVLEIAKSRFPYMGGNIVATFSLPSFDENFTSNKIINKELDEILKSKAKNLEKELLNKVTKTVK